MSLDPRFERTVLAEFALRERRARRRSLPHDPSRAARALAESLHRDHHELLAHLARVAFSVPARYRRAAWLHRAGEANVAWSALAAPGLTNEELAAVRLLWRGNVDSARSSLVRYARSLAVAPGSAGRIARVVARAALEDRLDDAPSDGDLLRALVLLPEPELGQ